jgi:hypothetical protein
VTVAGSADERIDVARQILLRRDPGSKQKHQAEDP